jgi:hypothetical protein
MEAVLDTLIHMKLTVPAETLPNLAPDFSNDIAVLLARMPEEEAGPLSLDFYRSPPEQDSPLQCVSAALLALHPPPEFEGDLLAKISARAEMFVVLPGSERFGGGSGGTCCWSSELPREDWPATGQYVLSKQKSDGASLVVVGIDPIYVIRTESTRYLGSGCGMSYGVYLGPEERRRLIAGMLGVPPGEIPWQTTPQTTIEFQSLEQFNIALLAFIEEQQQMYRATGEALGAHDLMAPSNALQSIPELKLNLDDMRGAGADAIPKVANLPSRVEWSSSPF